MKIGSETDTPKSLNRAVDGATVPSACHHVARRARCNHARSLKGTPEFERSSNARKKVEMRFAHLKVQHGFERMRLRGLTGVRDEFHLAAIVQNLKTMALRLLGPPTDGACTSIA